ncbi:MAG: M14 family metallopeptidase, partial [Bacillota bacterium]
MSEHLSMSFDGFYTYDELTDFLKTASSVYPQLTKLESIGKSYEGRDIWAITITNSDTGPAEDKPAMYVDGNIHAGEVTGCAVCMYTIQHLLNNYGTDEVVTELLDTRAFYVLPRVNPDGAEVYLTSPDMLRSSVRPNPDFEWKDNHLYPEDIDGDGEILTMRLPDPNGTHKVSEKDPRLMVPRRPDDFGGTYYNLLPEGIIHNYDGSEIAIGPRKWDLDINRNFPADWKPTQAGGGRYPLSEPETRAMVDFILAHPNIATLQAYHTFAGIILRPSCTRPDDDLDGDDIRAFESVGELGTETTDYPVRSVYHGFTRDKGTARHGVFIDWVYENLGILGYTTELWNKYSRAGIDADDIPFGKSVPEEQMLRLLEWHDEEGLDSFIPWREVDHPQLGKVEVGGFRQKTFQQNAHFKFLEDECHKNTIFNLQESETRSGQRMLQVEY